MAYIFFLTFSAVRHVKVNLVLCTDYFRAERDEKRNYTRLVMEKLRERVGAEFRTAVTSKFMATLRN